MAMTVEDYETESVEIVYSSDSAPVSFVLSSDISVEIPVGNTVNMCNPPQCDCDIWQVTTDPDKCWCTTGQSYKCPNECCSL